MMLFCSVWLTVLLVSQSQAAYDVITQHWTTFTFTQVLQVLNSSVIYQKRMICWFHSFIYIYCFLNYSFEYKTCLMCLNCNDSESTTNVNETQDVKHLSLRTVAMLSYEPSFNCSIVWCINFGSGSLYIYSMTTRPIHIRHDVEFTHTQHHCH